MLEKNIQLLLKSVFWVKVLQKPDLKIHGHPWILPVKEFIFSETIRVELHIKNWTYWTLSCNLGQNISNKVRYQAKIGQEQKTLITGSA